MFRKISAIKVLVFLPALCLPLQMQIYGVTFHLGFFMSYLVASVLALGGGGVSDPGLRNSALILIVIIIVSLLFRVDDVDLSYLLIYCQLILFPVMVVINSLLLGTEFDRIPLSFKRYLRLLRQKKISPHFFLILLIMSLAYVFNSREATLTAQWLVFPYFEQYFGFEYLIVGVLIGAPVYFFFVIILLALLTANKSLAICTVLVYGISKIKFRPVSSSWWVITSTVLAIIFTFLACFFLEPVTQVLAELIGTRRVDQILLHFSMVFDLFPLSILAPQLLVPGDYLSGGAHIATLSIFMASGLFGLYFYIKLVFRLHDSFRGTDSNLTMFLFFISGATVVMWFTSYVFLAAAYHLALKVEHRSGDKASAC